MADDQTQVENTPETEDINSWAAAFAQLEQQHDKAPVPTEHGEESDATATDADQGTAPARDEAADTTGLEDQGGGPDTSEPVDQGESAETNTDTLGITEEYLEGVYEAYAGELRDQAITNVAKRFIEAGERNNNGRLGANIDDPDICRKDNNGVPHFFNPETGQEFRGDNPRRQAQEWCDDFNAEMAQRFNAACEEESNKLANDVAPELEVLQFAPTYEQLDPIRQNLLDSMIESFEIKDDNGDVVGYSIDLNEALASVNRQVAAIQAYAKTVKPPEPASGPALDMRNSAGQVKAEGHKEFKSIAEAMEYEQDKLLESLKKGK